MLFKRKKKKEDGIPSYVLVNELGEFLYNSYLELFQYFKPFQDVKYYRQRFSCPVNDHIKIDIISYRNDYKTFNYNRLMFEIMNVEIFIDKYCVIEMEIARNKYDEDNLWDIYDCKKNYELPEGAKQDIEKWLIDITEKNLRKIEEENQLKEERQKNQKIIDSFWN